MNPMRSGSPADLPGRLERHDEKHVESHKLIRELTESRAVERRLGAGYARCQRRAAATGRDFATCLLNFRNRHKTELLHVT